MTGGVHLTRCAARRDTRQTIGRAERCRYTSSTDSTRSGHARLMIITTRSSSSSIVATIINIAIITCRYYELLESTLLVDASATVARTRDCLRPLQGCVSNARTVESEGEHIYHIFGDSVTR